MDLQANGMLKSRYMWRPKTIPICCISRMSVFVSVTQHTMAKKFVPRSSARLLVMSSIADFDRLAYISFLLGQNFDGFEQWRALLLLLCGCEDAAMRRTEA